MSYEPQTHSMPISLPRSRSDFSYVHLTPNEKRRTTDFSHLLSNFDPLRLKDPPYAKLQCESAIVHQPTHINPVPRHITSHFNMSTETVTTKVGPPTSPLATGLPKSQTFHLNSSSIAKPQDLTKQVLVSRMCQNATGGANKVQSPEVIRSQSMKTFNQRKESSPRRSRTDETLKNCSGPTGFCRLAEEGDYRRLRNFSITPKGLVNWGDSFRSWSMPFVPLKDINDGYDMRASSSAGSDGFTQSSSDNCDFEETTEPSSHRISILGSSNVGKTTMMQQFKTSEYICDFDTIASDDNNDCAISVILNGEESELKFSDSLSLEDETDDEDSLSTESPITIPTADAYLVVYSVTSRRSFLNALKLLERVQSNSNCPIILVGNKADLVRIRAVTTDEARSSAKELSCQFMETSVAINHQVDELLVAILAEIRAKRSNSSTCKLSPSQCSLSKAKGLIKKFLKKACFQSKSCNSLQRL